MNTGRPKVLLHIGLHKTGTRFLQREVFGQLDPTQFSVNPEPLWPAVRQEDLLQRPVAATALIARALGGGTAAALFSTASTRTPTRRGPAGPPRHA
ncbi:hypothetical protein [Thiohalospira sp.]|uniref:hypothetical protein n=1 Tax=Thiohalospira sp. TaxID=3080549 RepID=UPI003980CD6F